MMTHVMYLRLEIHCGNERTTIEAKQALLAIHVLYVSKIYGSLSRMEDRTMADRELKMIPPMCDEAMKLIGGAEPQPAIRRNQITDRARRATSPVEATRERVGPLYRAPRVIRSSSNEENMVYSYNCRGPRQHLINDQFLDALLHKRPLVVVLVNCPDRFRDERRGNYVRCRGDGSPNSGCFNIFVREDIRILNSGRVESRTSAASACRKVHHLYLDIELATPSNQRETHRIVAVYHPTHPGQRLTRCGDSIKAQLREVLDGGSNTHVTGAMNLRSNQAHTLLDEHGFESKLIYTGSHRRVRPQLVANVTKNGHESPHSRGTLYTNNSRSMRRNEYPMLPSDVLPGYLIGEASSKVIRCELIPGAGNIVE